MAKLDNIRVEIKDGKILLLIDTGLSVGNGVKNPELVYFANTGGPIELPGVENVKLALAMWYKPAKEAAPKAAATVESAVKPSPVKVAFSASAKATPAKQTVNINRIKG